MHQKIAILFILCLIIPLGSLAQELKNNQPAESICQTITTTEASAILPNESLDKAVRKKKKISSLTRKTEISRNNVSEKGFDLDIIWIEGEKHLLTMPGSQYKLVISYDSRKAEIAEAVFTLTDTSMPDRVMKFQHKFRPPFGKDLEAELKKQFDRTQAALATGSNDNTNLIKDFDLRPFYQRFIKTLALEQTKK